MTHKHTLVTVAFVLVARCTRRCQVRRLCFGDPATPPCDTGQDINGDGTVNVLDLIELLLSSVKRACDPCVGFTVIWRHSHGRQSGQGMACNGVILNEQ